MCCKCSHRKRTNGSTFLDTCRGEVFCFCNKSGGWFVNYGINRNNSPYEKNNPHTDCYTYLFWCRLYCFLFSVGVHTQLVSCIGKTFLYTPDIAFPIAWSFIYLCMGISIGLIWHIWTIRRQMIIRLFGFQLLFNFTWSIFFFLFSESVARFCKYSGAGCACYLLYDRKLSGEEIFGISFCSLSFVVASCHLS